MVYLTDPASGRLRFAHEAGISNRRALARVRRIALEPGQGMFGRAAALRTVVVTRDYPNDPSFHHAPDPDKVVADIGIRSMVVAPLVVGDEVLGALGTFSTEVDAFDPAGIALVRSLADHAAAAMANSRLIAELDRSRTELAERAEVEHSLREITARISAAHDLGETLQQSVDEAARLLHGDGAMIDLLESRSGLRRWAYASGIMLDEDESTLVLTADDVDNAELDQGVSGQAIARRAPFWTGDYLADDRFRHGAYVDAFIERTGIRSVLATPLLSDGEVIGDLAVSARRPHAWSDADAPRLEAIAAQAAIAIGRARLIEELDRSRTELAERAEIERALREINERISAAADLSDVLQRAIDEATRLLRADGARIDLIDDSIGLLRGEYSSGPIPPDEENWPDDPDETIEQGMSGQAVVTGRSRWTGDYLADDSFPHGAGADSYIHAAGIHSVLAAPLIGEAGPFGALTVFSSRTDAWAAGDAPRLEAIAAQAAIAITRTRLIEELDRSRAALSRRAEAERALREIAARITSMRDPADILQEVIELASRLVRGQGAILDLLDPVTGDLRWAYDDGLRARFSEEERAKLWISLGVGATGIAVAEDRVVVAGGDLVTLFPPAPESTAFFERTGFQSMIAAPVSGEDGPLGVIEVYSVAPDAFDDADADLIRALAGQAAIAITNARLIRELEQSREENARRADAERTLREIAARVTATLDPTDVLARIVSEAVRLLGSDGARIDLWDEELGALRWVHAAGDAMRDIPDFARDGGLRPRQAAAGLAFAEQVPVMTEDYLADERFESTPEIEAFVRSAGIRAVIATPLIDERGPIGVLSVVSRQPGAYGWSDVEVLAALAAQASIAMTNAHLVSELDASRAEVERRAEAERALRLITTRITVLREPDTVLQLVADEARRLLRADAAVIDEFDPASETLHWAYDAGLSDAQREAVRLSNLRLGEGVSGTAVAERRVVTVGDYARGEFQHDELADSLARGAGIRDLIVAPIIGEAGPLGAIEVMSRQADAFDEFDGAVIGALAEQAAIAITNARLIGELERSQVALARRAETERSLRDITARIAALHDPDEVLWRVVEDARRLLGTDGAHLTRMDPTGTYLVPVVVDGTASKRTREWLLTREFPLGGGINGLAAAEGAPVWTFDYGSDPRIPHEADDDEVARRLRLRGMAAAPLRAPGGEVIGTLAVSTARPRTFEPDELDLLQGLADQAAIALTNSNLLARVTREEARFRGLVQTTPDVIWRADPDGFLTFMADSAEALFGWPVDQIIGKHFGFLTDAGSMGLAVERYLAAGRDPELVDQVPLLLVRRDGTTFDAEVTIAGVFEDGRWVGAQGTVRDVSERRRLERDLRRSEERYRYLVQNAPDLVWSMDGDARLTFLSDACERMTGFRPEELIGRHFGAIVHESSRDIAEIDWSSAIDAPSQEIRGRINLQHRDGSPVPAEFIAVATLDADGRFGGANGSVRDMRERDRLEHELRRSEERYRFLVDNSPDIIFSVDPEGRFSYVSESIRRALGHEPGALIGQPISAVVHYPPGDAPGRRFQRIREDPDVELVERMTLVHADGRLLPFEVSSVGVRIDGEFAGIHGAARDMSERELLERELRASEERYRFLIENSPDAVFATDEQGRFTFLSAAIESMTGRRPEELVGQHFSTLLDEASLAIAASNWEQLNRNPEFEAQAVVNLRSRDGRLTPVDVRARSVFVDDRFTGMQGATRDISEQVRLQTELRRQAGELAAGEERAHLARELHDSVTQALFSMTLVSRSIELLLERDPDAARTQLAQLRELQREALAEMRALIFELRPGNLEQEGLVRALKTHSGALQGRIGLPIVMDSDLEGRLPLPIEEVLYRIAQEALHNVVKHAAAHEVHVGLRRRRGVVTLTVADDGKGFDPASVPDGHLGLAGMRARAERIGATFSCTSGQGRGTTVEVRVPARVIEDQAVATAGSPSATAAASMSIRDE